MEYPLISIAIPVYNTGRYLRSCLESVVVQKYPNLEIVVLNNGSTDESLQIIEEFASKDCRLKYYTIDHVPTIKESKFNCFKRINGEWVIPIDSDDTISPTYVMDMWESHVKTGADMIVAQMITVDESGKEYNRLPADDFDISIVYTGVEACRRTILKWELGINGAFYSRSNLYNIMLDNPDVEIYTDEHDSRVLLKNAKKVGFSKAKYYYMFNPNSVGKKNSWGKYRYKLVTRIGLLKMTKQDYTVKSIEYEHTVMEALLLGILACKHKLLNPTLYSDDDKAEFNSVMLQIYNDSRIKSMSLRSAFNLVLKASLRLMLKICKVHL